MQKDFKDLKDGVSRHDIPNSRNCPRAQSVNFFVSSISWFNLYTNTFQHWKPEFCVSGAPLTHTRRCFAINTNHVYQIVAFTSRGFEGLWKWNHQEEGFRSGKGQSARRGSGFRDSSDREKWSFLCFVSERYNLAFSCHFPAVELKVL